MRLRIDRDPKPYELIDNELARGRVEICINEKFGTVCDELWSHTHASVVCRQLGFSPYGKQLFHMPIRDTPYSVYDI